jgi:hypothetical protein
MFRKALTIAIALLAAIGGLTISGCGNQAEPAKPNAEKKETDLQGSASISWACVSPWFRRKSDTFITL